MNFEESFFQSSSGSEDEKCIDSPKENTQVLYIPKKCEPNWFLEFSSPAGISLRSDSIHGLEFAVCKHKADLLYHQKDYGGAVGLYEALLTVIPASNSCVTREVRDGLARCYLKLGKGELARAEAEKLVAPPHEKDWSSWKLLSQCHGLLKDHAAEVMALQTSTLLQRCHSNFWVHLSRAYGKLRETVLQDCGATGDTCSVGNKEILTVLQDCGGTGDSCPVGNKEILGVTLAQTALLFRPYFTWRLPTAVVSNSEGAVRVDTSSCIGALQDTQSTVQQDTAHQDTPSAIHQDTPSAGHQDAPSTVHQDTPSSGHQDAPSTVHQDTTSTVHQDALCSQAVSKGDSTMDIELCVFFDVPVSQDPSLYAPTLGMKCNSLPVTQEHGLVPALDLPLCFYHSPFVMLVRQLLCPDEFITLTVMLHQRSLSCVAHQLWSTIYAMAESSCLVWARSLLEYSLRHSHSFPVEAVQSQLREVEQQLASCPTPVRNYILGHFSKKAVFDDH